MGFLILFWFVLCKEKRNFVFSVLLAGVGICMMMITTLAYTFGGVRFIPLFMDWSSDRGFFFAASVMLAAIGVLGILLPKQRLD